MRSIISTIIFAMAISTVCFSAEIFPISPEDGSIQITKWYYCQKAGREINKNVFSTLRENGIEPMSLSHRFDCSHLQDIALFDEKGNVLLMSQQLINLGEEKLEAIRSTFLDDAPNAKPIHLTDDPFRGSRKMEYTFVEGGGVISGKFSNGETYAIISSSNFANTFKNFEVSKQEAKKMIAKDFGIKEKNLFVTSVGRHLDLYALALPNGTILIEHEYKPGDILASKLSKDSRFNIQRVSGIYGDRTNFFNGFVSKNNKGEVIVITNKAQDNDGNHLPNLEKTWSKILVKHGIKKENIHFEGNYYKGAGIDCIGAISP